MVKISVIVAVYNGEDSIKKCLMSIINQTFNDFELIVIDDGSIDNSLKIIEDTKENNQQVEFKILSRDNRGVAYSRQEGIQLSSGIYTIFLDSDDYASPNWLEKMYEVVLRDNADIIVCDYYTVESKNFLPTSQPLGYSGLDNIKLMLDGKLHGFLWNKLIRRSLYIENDIVFLENINYLEDFIVLMKLFNSAELVAKINEPLVFYTVDNPNSITNRISSDKVNQVISAVGYIDSYLKEIDSHRLLIDSFEQFKFSQKSWMINRYNGVVPRFLWCAFPELKVSFRKRKISILNYLMFYFSRHKLYNVSQFILTIKKILR